ncbi:MAG TPA: hypothetical protein VFA90_08915 [Terriglobales bacterium]|nr:hypothetical protein [Terriglobales bacterium]
MQFSRSFFFSLVCIAVTIPALAAEKQSSEKSTSNEASSTFDVAPQLVPTPFGMFALSRPLIQPSEPIVARRFTRFNDTACLTLRMYKVKRTERLSDGDTGMRGYTTCELASDYQMRSAIAHMGVDDSAGTEGK